MYFQVVSFKGATDTHLPYVKQLDIHSIILLVPSFFYFFFFFFVLVR